MKYTWHDIDSFLNYKAKLARPSWGDIESFLKQGDAVKGELQEQLRKELRFWDVNLKEYGKDTCRIDLKRFRILKTHREEDWSDWLAFLFEQSITGLLAEHCFDKHCSNKDLDFASPKEVRREQYGKADEGDEKNRKADILFIMKDFHCIHLEVKIDDKDYEKIYETAKQLRKKCKKMIGDFILLPSYYVDEFRKTKEEKEKDKKNGFNVKVITWEDISVGIRKSLIEHGGKREKRMWKAIAYLFLGAIEQKIFNHPHIEGINRLPINILSEMREIREVSND